MIKGEEKTDNPNANAAQQSQKQSEQALNSANEAQKKATDEEKKAAQAQADVQKKQQELTQAQQKARQEQAKAQQLQQQANQATQQATQQAEQSQRRATTALSSEAARTARGEHTVAGQIVAAGPEQLVLQASSGPMTLQMDQNTRVTIDGRESSATNIVQGEQARVSFQASSSSRPTATLVEVSSSGQLPPAGQGGAQGSSQGGAQGTGSGSSQPQGSSSSSGQ